MVHVGGFGLMKLRKFKRIYMAQRALDRHVQARYSSDLDNTMRRRLVESPDRAPTVDSIPRRASRSSWTLSNK